MNVSSPGLEPSESLLVQRGWNVAYTQPRREQIAEQNFKQQGYEAYLPRYKVLKKSAAGRVMVLEPMFPRYVFFRPAKVTQSISTARSTRGVSHVLRVGLALAVLTPQALQAIRVCEEVRNQADLADISPFQPGLRVRLSHCGLSGLEGVVKSVSGKRVKLLLEILGRQKEVLVEHGQLELA